MINSTVEFASTEGSFVLLLKSGVEGKKTLNSHSPPLTVYLLAGSENNYS